MVTEQQAAEWILDCDGSFRDVTFTPTTKVAVLGFLKKLLPEFAARTASDHNGIDRSAQLQTTDPLDGMDGYMHIVLGDGSGLIRHLQVFIDHQPDSDTYCIEASFRPSDIDQERFTLESFRSLVDAWNDALGAEDYFVRCENASWDLYDPLGLGVIYSRKCPPLV